MILTYFSCYILDQNGSNSNTIISDAINLCEERGDCFLVYDNTFLTDTVLMLKQILRLVTQVLLLYYPWVQIQDNTTGNFRYVPPSVVIGWCISF